MKFVSPLAPSVVVDRRSDGTILLRSDIALPEVPRSLPHLFDAVCGRAPDSIFMRQREAGGEWRSISYGAAQRAANGLAQWLIDCGAGFGDAVCFLSEPSIEHGIAAIGIQRSGAAIAPVSVAYSLQADGDFSRLRHCVQTIAAKIIIVGNAAAYASAMVALTDLDPIFIAVAGSVEGLIVHCWADVVATEPSPMVAERMERIKQDSVARIMFTSGSTGSPKATPQPQANLTVTVAQCDALRLLDFDGEQPQFLEAMPFSHIMAGNFNFNNLIAAGGTMWIDEGKPTPQLFGKTLANLRDISPHFFITVPLGYAMLCDAMEADDTLRDSFFRNLRFIGFGGALLSDHLRDRLMVLSRAARGGEVPFFNFYGATEYMSGALRYWSDGPTSVIGLPLPTTTLKLVPTGDRYELRVNSPTMMARGGYIGAPETSARLFDDEDFFQTGDAVSFADPADPSRGLTFAGRISEDFKLSSGTYVNSTILREDLLHALGDAVRELVLCGLNEPYVGALLWLADGVDRASGQNTVRDRIAAFNRTRNGSSRRIGSALIVEEPLSVAGGEITPKGNAAARVIRDRRPVAVARLFASGGSDDPEVLTFPAPTVTILQEVV